jgi:hypothetical protein
LKDPEAILEMTPNVGKEVKKITIVFDPKIIKHSPFETAIDLDEHLTER